MKLFVILFSILISLNVYAGLGPKKAPTIVDPIAEDNAKLEMAIKAETAALKSIDELGALTTTGGEKWDLERRRGESYLKLSRLYRLKGNNTGKVYPEIKEYLQKGQTLLVHLLDQKNDPALSMQLALTYKEQDQFDKALKLLAKVYSDPNADAGMISEAHFHEAEVLFEKKNFAGALKGYEKVDPESSIFGFARYKKAWALYNMKRNREAVSELVEVYHAQKKRNAKLDLKDDLIGSLALFSSEEKDDQYIFTLSEKHFDNEDRDIYLKSLVRLLINHGEAARASSLLKNWKGELATGIDFYRSLFQVEILLQEKKFSEIPEALTNLQAKCDPIKNSACRGEVKEVAQKALPYFKNKPTLLPQVLNAVSDYDFETDFKIELLQAYAMVEMEQKHFEESVAQWRKLIEIQSTQTSDKAALEESYSGLLKAGEQVANQKSSYKETYEQDLNQYLFNFPKGAEVPAVNFRLATAAFERKNYVTALEFLDKMDGKNKDLIDPAFDLRVQCMYELKKYDDVEKLVHNALNDPNTKSKDKYEEFLDRLALRKSAEAKDTVELMALYDKTKKPAIRQEIYRLILTKAQKRTNTNEMSFLLKHLNESGLTDALKKETFQYLIITAYKKDNWKEMHTQFQDYMRTSPKFLGSEEKVKFTEMDMFYSGNIQNLPDCNLSFKFEIACKLAQVQKNQLKGVFDWTKHAYHQTNSADQRRWIRYVQAQVLKAEFDEQSLKTSQPSRKNLLLNYKAEKLEKVLTALLDTLQMPAPVFFKYHVSREIIALQENFLKELQNDSILSADKNLIAQVQTQIASFREKVQEIDDLKKINAAFETVETRNVSTDGADSLSQLYKWIGLGTQKLGVEQTSGLISSWRKDERQFERILLYLDL